LLALAIVLSACGGASPAATTAAGPATPGGLDAVTRIPRPTGTPVIQKPGSQIKWPVTGVVRVDVGDDFFLPEIVTITVGSSVRWVSIAEEAHNVMADDSSWSVRDIGIGEFAEQRFNAPGRYPYYCTHAGTGMKGIVVVVPLP